MQPLWTVRRHVPAIVCLTGVPQVKSSGADLWWLILVMKAPSGQMRLWGLVKSFQPAASARVHTEPVGMAGR